MAAKIQMTQTLREALSMRDRGMTDAAIAKAKGLPTDTIRKAFREYDTAVADAR